MTNSKLLPSDEIKDMILVSKEEDEIISSE